MNLIVTCSRHLEEEASGEILEVLNELGDATPRAGYGRFSGIVVVSTALDPFEVVRKMKEKILSEPWSVRYCHRFIPIQESTKATVDANVSAVQRHVGKMLPGESYRITVEKRGSDISTKDLIESIAKTVTNKVSLEKYDWNILVETFGDIAGVSILKEDDILSTMKLKRDSTE